MILKTARQKRIAAYSFGFAACVFIIADYHLGSLEMDGYRMATFLLLLAIFWRVDAGK